MLSFSLESRILADLEEDRIRDDVTSRLLGKKGEIQSVAKIVAKESGIFSGEQILSAFVSLFANEIVLKESLTEGQKFQKGMVIAAISGKLSLLLTLERTMLNWLGQMCGVATLTSQFVEAVKPSPVKILATRKTLPGLREPQLAAVVAGGGFVHRRSLSDGILIKDNHLSFLSPMEILTNAERLRSPLHRIEIEVQNFDQLEEVLQSPPDIVMLDNFSIEDMKRAVKLINGKSKIEASGGVNLTTVRAIAETGVDYISVGALTHSARALDIALDFFGDFEPA